jgi:plastocyanin
MIPGLLAAAAAAQMAGSPGAAASVAIPGKLFSPASVTVLVGERVGWDNQDSTDHTVTAQDGSFDSGHVVPGGAFSTTFDRAGTVAYKCSLHRSMRGRVEVVAVALSGPDAPVPAGGAYTLAGRAPGAGVEVTLERVGEGAVATTTTDAEGRFSFPGRADVPSHYRASAGGQTSRVVAVRVAPAVEVAVRRAGRTVAVRVHVPGQAGGKVVLERYVRERFGYLPLRSAVLDAGDRARVVVRSVDRLRLRARLAGPVGGYARSVSAPVLVARR